MRQHLIGAGGLLFVVLLGGLDCGDYGSGANNPYQPPSAITVTLGSATFNAAVDTVAVNGTVTWNWATDAHNVLSTGSPAFTSEGSGGVSPVTFNMGHTYVVTFGTAGSYAYYCSVHGSPTAGMMGRIVVQ